MFYSQYSDIYIGFDFKEVWKFNNYSFINDGLPTLKSHDKLFLANADSALSNGEGLEGEGTVTNPFLIRTAGDLAYVSKEFNKSTTNFSGKYFLRLSDINLSGKAWIPIGSTSSFNGIFDGNGFAVSRISSSLQESFPNGYGLFGTTNDAIIKNLTVVDADYLTTGNSGMIVGNVDSGLNSAVTYSPRGASAGTDGCLGVEVHAVISIIGSKRLKKIFFIFEDFSRILRLRHRGIRGTGNHPDARHSSRITA